MITIKQIKEYIKCPQFGDLEYGKWGALKLEQRQAYRYLIDIVEGQDKDIERLNKILDDIETYIHLWKIDEIEEKTMLILNDILLIKNGMSAEVVRLKEKENE